MKTERELFLEWHFLQWKLHNAVTDTVDFARVLYDRVYSHDHTSSVREVEFKAWCASASREGYKLVPIEPSDYMKCTVRDFGPDIEDYENMSKWDWEKLCAEIYKAMIEAVEK